jgi:hypothetical protein
MTQSERRESVLKLQAQMCAHWEERDAHMTTSHSGTPHVDERASAATSPPRVARQASRDASPAEERAAAEVERRAIEDEELRVAHAQLCSAYDEAVQPLQRALRVRKASIVRRTLEAQRARSSAVAPPAFGLAELTAMYARVRASVASDAALTQWREVYAADATAPTGAEREGDDLPFEARNGEHAFIQDRVLTLLGVESAHAEFVYNTAKCARLEERLDRGGSELLRHSARLPAGMPGDEGGDGSEAAKEVGGALREDALDAEWGAVGHVEEEWQRARAAAPNGILDPVASVVWQQRAQLDRTRVSVRCEHIALRRRARFIAAELEKISRDGAALDSVAEGIATEARELLALTRAAARDDAALDTLARGGGGSIAPRNEVDAAEEELRQARDCLGALESAKARLAEEWSELETISTAYEYRTGEFEAQTQRATHGPRRLLESAKARLAEEWSELDTISASHEYRAGEFEAQTQRATHGALALERRGRSHQYAQLREAGVRAVDGEAAPPPFGARGALSRYAHAHRSAFVGTRDLRGAGGAALAAVHVRPGVGTAPVPKRDARGALRESPRVHVSRHGSISIGAAPSAAAPPRRQWTRRDIL